MSRYYYESDGDAWNRSHYVIDDEPGPCLHGHAWCDGFCNHRRDFASKAEALSWIAAQAIKDALERDDHREPTYANQLWHARQFLAEKGRDALNNPHGMTGRTCGCGECFAARRLRSFASTTARCPVGRDSDALRAQLDAAARALVADCPHGTGPMVFMMDGGCKDCTIDVLVRAMRDIANEPCDHGPQPFCPRELARDTLSRVLPSRTPIGGK